MEWSWWQKAMALLGATLAMWAIVPLMVWGGTGSWRRALQALREYALIIAALVVVGGGLGFVMAISEHGIGAMLALIPGH